MPISTAFSDCAEGTYRTRGTITAVDAYSLSASVQLDLPDAACPINFDVARPVDDWPSWPWLVEGAQLDVSLWDMGVNGRGLDPVWMVLRGGVTGDPLLSIYQLNGVLLADGTFRDEIGIDGKIVGPVCKDSASAQSGLIVQGYDIELSSQGERIILGQMSQGSLPSSNATPIWKIQTGVLENNVLDANSTLLDASEGEYFQVVAWTEVQ